PHRILDVACYCLAVFEEEWRLKKHCTFFIDERLKKHEIKRYGWQECITCKENAVFKERYPGTTERS
ncbi:MAG: hypothetical protein RI573_10635, partial [Balneolaceae bacterium]|nr:hypothetical protein [Balneolaceae bacterium]